MAQLVNPKTEYFQGQAVLQIAKVINGIPGPFRKVGNLKGLSVTQKQSSEKHKETQSGLALTDLVIYGEPEIEIDFDLENVLDLENLKMYLRGKGVKSPAKTVTDEPVQPGLVDGDSVILRGINVSNVKLTDADGKPLTAGTHFRFDPQGTVEMLNISTFKQPFKADYDQGAVDIITMMTGDRPEFWFRISGVNRLQNLRPLLVDYYRVQTDLGEKLELISEKMTSVPIKAQALADLTKDMDGEYGPFGRIVPLPMAA